MTSSQSDLTERLRQKLETERLEIEKTARRELRRLGESLRAAANNSTNNRYCASNASESAAEGSLPRNNSYSTDCSAVIVEAVHYLLDIPRQGSCPDFAEGCGGPHGV